MSSVQGFVFLNLPQLVRDGIYEMLLVWGVKGGAVILRTSHQIHDEAARVYWLKNTFRVVVNPCTVHYSASRLELFEVFRTRYYSSVVPRVHHHRIKKIYLDVFVHKNHPSEPTYNHSALACMKLDEFVRCFESYGLLQMAIEFLNFTNEGEDDPAMVLEPLSNLRELKKVEFKGSSLGLSVEVRERIARLMTSSRTVLGRDTGAEGQETSIDNVESPEHGDGVIGGTRC